MGSNGENEPLIRDHRLNSPPYDEANNHGEEDRSINSVPNIGGLTVVKCAVFIVAQMAGSGILALPNAVSGTGWIGVLIMTSMCCLACYCGVMLGKSWMLVRHNTVDNGHVRDPYPLIGYYGLGKAGKILAEVCIFLTLIGASVVFLLIASQQISSILNVKLGYFDTPKTEFRVWILICGFILLPLTWFASPKEMWFIAYAASACTLLACFLIIIRSCMKIHEDGPVSSSQHGSVTVESFFTAFGTIAFAFGGATIFPTFQADMKEPSKFKYAASLGFFLVYLLYLPVAILPYIALESKQMDSNVLTALKNLDGKVGKRMITAAEIMITFHLLFAVIIVNNPISQQVEEYLKIPLRFGWKRIATRSSIMLLVIAIAEAFPNFGPILSFIGASTITMMCFILPAVLYLKLQSSYLVPLHQKVFHVEIIVIALACGCCGMYSAIQGFSNPFKT